MVKFGFIGIGIMGRGMAMNLVKKGFDVTVGGPSPFARCTCAIAPRDAPITYCRGGPAAAEQAGGRCGHVCSEKCGWAIGRSAAVAAAIAPLFCACPGRFASC